VGTVFRKQITKKLPDAAELFIRKGERFARWRDAKGKARIAPVTVGRDGTPRLVVKARTYTAKFRDGSDTVREVATGCRDEQAARAILADFERRAVRVKAKILTPAEDSVADHYAMPLAAHFNDYTSTQQAKGLHPTRIANATHRLQLVANGSGWRQLGDVNAAGLIKWLLAAGSGPQNQISAATRNEYRQEWITFANWCVTTNRLASNPLSTVPRVDSKADKRRQRRALTEADLATLLRVARLRPLAEFGRKSVRAEDSEPKGETKQKRRSWTFKELTLADLHDARARARHSLRKSPQQIERLEQLGHERALIYKTLILTGLRRGELAALTVGQFHLSGPCPYADLQAADAKNGQAAQIPLRSELAADLKAWIESLRERELRNSEAATGESCLRLSTVAVLPLDRPLFTVPKALVKILDRDLRLAGIPKRDESGRTVDVHALRHCFGTLLSRSGVAPRTAQAAMRHSSVNLTMNVYVDPKLLDVHQAVESLPELALCRPDQPEQLRATGTFGADSQFAPKFAPAIGNSGHSETIAVKSAADGDKSSGVRHRDVSRELDKRNNPLSACDNGLREVERKGVEPSTFALRTRRSPN
jgi:integrase